jgi:hypothetical protein
VNDVIEQLISVAKRQYPDDLEAQYRYLCDLLIVKLREYAFKREPSSV